MIRSILRMTPREGRHDDVLAFYEEHGILARALGDEGCIALELQVRLPRRDQIVVTGLWRSAADYEAWVASSGRATEVARLRELLDPSAASLGAGEVFEVASRLSKEPV